jgi:hypothetical protein
MGQRSDLLTVALTGQLAFTLIVAAVLSFVTSCLLLMLYRRAVIKSMRRRSQNDLLETKGFLPPELETKPHDGALNLNFVSLDSHEINARGAELYRHAIRRRWVIALIHSIAGFAFAATMTAAFLSAGKMEFSPFRFIFLTWVNAWPVIIAISLAVGLSRRGKLVASATYFVVGAVVMTIVLSKNPSVSLGQLLYIWLDTNLPPTLLLLVFLNRRIRAVGPLVLVFMILGVAGANLVVTLVGNNRTLLKALSELSMSIGLGAVGTMVLLHLLGFAAFAIIGWMILSTLRSLYELKRISEQSITIDAVWLVFGIVNSIGLVFQGHLWILGGVAAYVVYKFVAAGLFKLFGIARRSQFSGRRLLLLRVFALGKRSEELYDKLGKSWRTVGSIQMIAGPDLATSSIEPHEFLDFLTGKLDRRFIDSGRTLDLRINQMDLRPDKEGQFRVTEFFCHDDTWKMSLARLADESDVVLMDLRGFSPANTGCIFEIKELFNVVALSSLVFVLDDTTDQTFMEQTMQQAWREIKDRSPNRRLNAGKISLVGLSGMSHTGYHNLLYAICAAASNAPV